MAHKDEFPAQDERFAFIKSYLNEHRMISLHEEVFFKAYVERFPCYVLSEHSVKKRLICHKAKQDLAAMEQEGILQSKLGELINNNTREKFYKLNIALANPFLTGQRLKA